MATTAANAADVTQACVLLHGDETEAWGDAGYQGVDKRPENRGCGVAWQVAMKPGKRRLLDRDGAEAAAEKRKASVRAKVEHPFLYVKRRFGYGKVRYRGLAKNTQRIGCAGFSLLIAPLRDRMRGPSPMGRARAGAGHIEATLTVDRLSARQPTLHRSDRPS